MTKYILVNNVFLDGEVKPSGSVVEIPEEQAKGLLERGSITTDENFKPKAQLSAFELAQQDFEASVGGKQKAEDAEFSAKVEELRAEKIELDTVTDTTPTQEVEKQEAPLVQQQEVVQAPPVAVQPPQVTQIQVQEPGITLTPEQIQQDLESAQ